MSSIQVLNNETITFFPSVVVSVINLVVRSCASFNLVGSVFPFYQIGFLARYLPRAHFFYKVQNGSETCSKDYLLLTVSGLLRSFIGSMYSLSADKCELGSVKQSITYAFILSIENIVLLLLSIKKAYNDYCDNYNPTISFIKKFIKFISSSEFSSFITKAVLTFAYLYCVFVANIKQSMWWAFFAFAIEIIINGKKLQKFFSSIDFFGLKKKKDFDKTIGHEMVQYYKKHGGDPILGRDEEISNVCQILSKSKKSSVVLVGEPGVGKTAIVEGLVQAIANDDVPKSIKNKKVFCLNVASLIADTAFRGQFEKKVISLIEKLEKDGDTILFIDEIHTIMGAGSIYGGSMDFANILKESLARGRIQCIGATTCKEYKIIEKDSAMVRRLEKIKIEPTSKESTLKILRSLKDKYEQKHACILSDDILIAIVTMTDKYIIEGQLPDKAIDILEECVVFAEDSFNQRKDIEIDEKCEVSLSDIRAVIARKISVQFERDEDETKLVLVDVLEKAGKSDDLKEISIFNKAKEKVDSIKRNLMSMVVGQDDAVNAICDSLLRVYSGIKTRNRTVGTFLLLGNPGVGKTFIARSTAQSLYEDASRIITLNMADYASESAAISLVGGPKKSRTAKTGFLISQLLMHKNTVILMNNIEKAHPSVVSAILSLLEDGVYLDGSGTYVEFNNKIIIMTSSIGSKELVGSADLSKDDLEKVRSKLLQQVKEFDKRLIDQVDSVVILNSLTKEALLELLEIEIMKLSIGFSSNGVTLDVSKDVKEFIVEAAYESHAEARSILKSCDKLESMIINALSEQEDLNKVCVDLSLDGTTIIVKAEIE